MLISRRSLHNTYHRTTPCTDENEENDAKTFLLFKLIVRRLRRSAQFTCGADLSTHNTYHRTTSCTDENEENDAKTILLFKLIVRRLRRSAQFTCGADLLIQFA